MELYSVEMALAIAVGVATMTHWLASMVENREPVSNDNRELTDVDPPASLLSSAESSSASMVENPDDTSLVSSAAPRQKYDVFLSFRGADTRTGFVSHLYHELQTVSGIQTFMDDKDLETGAPISSSLLKAIKKSNFAIVVLSKNYAQSAWCLEELTEICQCMKDKNRILPLFYYVQPSDVRHQKGTFGAALTKHGNLGRHKSGKVQQWKDALHKVAGFSGLNAEGFGTERDLVEAIVESVWSKVRPIGIKFIISSIDFEPFEATREAMDKVMEALKDENVTSIGVYGMAGVGKSTMVEHAGLEAQNKRLYPQVILARISLEPNLWNIQGTLADMLGVKLVDATVTGRANTLWKKIRSGKRILIILDDIWTYIKLSDIGIPSPKELKSRNSKLLLTTRNKDVCRRMECQAKIPLNTLAEQDSWELFKRNAGESFDSTKLYCVAKEVAKECAGLPVALIAVAKALRDKNFDQWKDAARRLKESKPPKPEDERHVFECIKLSYDYLNSDDSKSCFLLCCLFPEGYDIQIEDLLKYGIGKGLFREDYMQDARATIRSVVESLKDSSLLLDGKVDRGCVRMHDVIRDVAISISLSMDGHQKYFVKAGCELQSWPRIDAHGCYNAISLMKNKIRMLPKYLVCSELQILLLQSNCYNEIPDGLFQRLEALRVLDLSQTSISSLPPSFNYLSSLHSLYLDGCISMKNNISLVGELGNLEILSMRELDLEKLPKEVGQLTKLRVLDFTRASVHIVPSEVIGNLSDLEELCMQCNFADWGSRGGESEAEGPREETAFFDELTSLLHLHMLKVFISDPKCLPTSVEDELQWENFDICIGRGQSITELSLDSTSSPDSKALTLDATMDTLPEWFIDVVTNKTEKLQYKNCGGLGNLLMEYEWGRLHKLKYLSVIGPNEKLKELINTVTRIRNEPVYQNLEELHPDKVNCLEELCVLDSEKLKELMNTITGIRNELVFQNLEELHLDKANWLEELCVSDIEKLKELMNTITRIRKEPVFQNLEELHLDKVNCLEKLCVGELPTGSLCNLRLVKVRDCQKLMNAFLQSNLLRRLQNLEKLCCEDMDELEYVFSSEGSELEQITLTKLIEMRLEKLGNLIKIWNGPAPREIFCHVKILVVFKCHKLKNLFTSDVAHHLRDLEDLSVKDCKGLERVIEASEETVHHKIVLPKLKKLALNQLPALTRFYGSTGSAIAEESIEFPSLEHSCVERCVKFQSPVKDRLVSRMKKHHVLILSKGQRETPTSSRRR